jgi:beta-glucosidase
MEMGWLEEYASIKAAVWVGIPGEVSFDCVGKLLKGDINPSGKLADTVAYRITDHPSNENFGDFSYTGGGLNNSKFVEYREGIYVGYRYFETFAPDKVQYPFGYGLSYTSFSVTADRFTADAATVAVRVTVKNTGGVAGKEVVQLYYSPPYTPAELKKARLFSALTPKRTCSNRDKAKL